MTNGFSTDVTVIGLGRMGSALARAFVAGGQRVTVWNRNPAKAAAIEGARACQTLDAAVNASPLIVVCVTKYATWSDLIDQIPDGGLAGKTILQLSSGAADEAVDLAARQTQLLARSLDGAIMAFPPALGTPAAAIMVAGDAAAWGEHAEIIGKLGSIEYLGPRISEANTLDSAILIFVFGSLLSAIQAGAFVAAAGAPLDGLAGRLTDAARALPGMIAGATMAMQQGAHPGDEVSLHTLKDLWRQMSAFLQRSGGRTDFVDTLERLSQASIDAGHGDDYFTAVFEILRPGVVAKA